MSICDLTLAKSDLKMLIIDIGRLPLSDFATPPWQTKQHMQGSKSTDIIPFDTNDVVQSIELA